MFYTDFCVFCVWILCPVAPGTSAPHIVFLFKCPKVAWTFHCCPLRDLWWSQGLNVPSVQQKHRWNLLVKVCAVEKRFSSCLTTGTSPGGWECWKGDWNHSWLVEDFLHCVVCLLENKHASPDELQQPLLCICEHAGCETAPLSSLRQG